MALRKCDECSKEISTDAKTCPNCGAIQPKKTSLVTWAIALFFGVVLFNMISRSSESDTKSAAKPSAVSSSAIENFITDSKKNDSPVSLWLYEEKIDQMNGGKDFFAIVSANASLKFSAPYAGTNFPTITLRKSSSGELAVMLGIQKGQFICQDCEIKIRFDDKPASKFKASKPADFSSTLLFLDPASKFIKSAKNAKQVFVEATFYNEGRQVMVFDIADLVWKH